MSDQAMVERVARAIYARRVELVQGIDDFGADETYTEEAMQMARAAIEAMREPPAHPMSAPRWMPIESAPKDGWVLTWGCLHDDGVNMGETPRVRISVWETRWYSLCSGSHAATHWMPLPKPPEK